MNESRPTSKDDDGRVHSSQMSEHKMSRIVRKPDFCLGENKGADQLRSNCDADQRLCFCYTDSKIPLLSKFEFSSLTSSSVLVELGLCQTWSETLKTGFLVYGSNNLKHVYFRQKEGYMTISNRRCRNLGHHFWTA